MTQTNIYAMDRIVDLLGSGMKFANALSHVYTKRKVVIPYNEVDLCVLLENLGMSARTTNALRRSRMTTLGDVVKYSESQHLKTIPNLGTLSIRETMETILNYCWDNLCADCSCFSQRCR